MTFVKIIPTLLLSSFLQVAVAQTNDVKPTESNEAKQESTDEINPYANEQIADDATNPSPLGLDTNNISITYDDYNIEVADFLYGTWGLQNVLITKPDSTELLVPQIDFFQLRFTDSKTLIFRLNDRLPEQKAVWNYEGNAIVAAAMILKGCEDCVNQIRLDNFVKTETGFEADIFIENNMSQSANGHISCNK
ncbi:MAG: hypothetical protein K9J17_01890 [Flavobacteriales bacterium]|nr:hypothetical protein [Flavobacteriales bacterium]